MKRIGSFGLRACAALAAFGLAFTVSAADIPASAYIQDGLVAHYDAIANAGVSGGVDQHSENPDRWVNLADGASDAVLPASGCTVKAKSIVLNNVCAEVTGLSCAQCATPVTFEGSARFAGTPKSTSSTMIVQATGRGGIGYDIRNLQGIAFIEPSSASWGSHLKNFFWAGNFTYSTKGYSDVRHSFSVVSSVTESKTAYAKNTSTPVYFDGVQQMSYGNGWNSGSASAAPDGTVYIGYSTAVYEINAVRIYNRALSAREIAYNVTIDKIRFDAADPTSVTWPEGYQFNADSQRIESRIKVTCDAQCGTVAIGAGTEAWGTGDETAKLVATPAEGWRFVRWEGDTHGLAGTLLTSPELTVAFADQARVLTAVFNQGDAFTSLDYAQEGLVFQLDGIENAGRDEHDAGAKAWIDLVSGAKVSLTTNDTVGAKFIKLIDSKTISGFPKLNDSGIVSITVELCQRATKVLPSNTTGQLSFRAGGRCYLGYRFVSGDVGCVSSFVGSAKDASFPTPHPYYGVDNGMLRPLAQNEHHTFAAVASIGSASVWFNGEPRPHTTSSVVSSWDSANDAGAIGNATSQPEYYAVRVYNRALTQAELERHARLDRIRFFGADEGMRPGVAGDEYRVRVTKPDGSVTDTWYAVGETANLSYSPRVGEAFRFWKPAPEGVDRTQTSISFTVNEPLSTVARVVDDPSRLTAASYVREGLVLQFDGIANAGVDADGDELHDGKSCWWRDLSGEGQDAYVYDKDSKLKWLDDACDETASGYLAGGYFKFPIGDAFYAAQNNRNASTIQLCGRKRSETGSNTVRANVVGNKTGWSYHMDDLASSLTYYICGQGYKFTNAKVVTNMTLTTSFTTAGAPSGNGFLRYWFGSGAVVQSTVSTSDMKTLTGRDGYIFSTADYDQGFILRAARFYNRELTDYERLLNTRIDEERFYGTNATRIVSVESESANFGEPSGFGYGAYRVKPGEAISCSFTDSLELFDDGIRALPIADGERTGLVGYTVTNRVTGSYSNETASEFNGTAEDDFRLIWHWRHQYQLKYVAATGGRVYCEKGSGGWFDEGASIMLDATPNAEYKFVGWAGDTVGIPDLTVQTIFVPIDQTRSLTAVFQERHHEPVSLTWQAATPGRWSDPANWGGTVPQEGDFVTIGAGAEVTLDTATPPLGSLTLEGTLSSGGWDNMISAETLTVGSGGLLTCAGDFGSSGNPSNRVWICCSNLVVAGGGAIDVTGKGWKAASGVYGAGLGAGTAPCCGGCYGGFAGSGYISIENSAQMKVPYGDAEDPRDPGSAGSAAVLGDVGHCGGAGGGAVLIEVTRAVTLNGGIFADGSNGSGSTSGAASGGGSGGGISIWCRTISGIGSVFARGGSHAATKGGNGSGGRIAVHYDLAEQAKLPRPELTFDAGTPIATTTYGYESSPDNGEGGTVWLPDAALIVPEPFNVTGQVLIDGAELSLSTLVIDSRRVAFTQDGFKLTVDGDVTLQGTSAATLELGGSLLVHRAYGCSSTTDHTGFRRFGNAEPVDIRIGGKLTVGGARSEVVLRGAKMTAADADPADCRPVGGILKVGGTLSVAKNGRIVPVSHYCTGVSPRIACGNFELAEGATVTASLQGYYSKNVVATLPLEGQTGIGFGPGSYTAGFTDYRAPGASHFGLGGSGAQALGESLPKHLLYDTPDMPHMPGSGCANTSGNIHTAGGGVIFIEVEGRCHLEGKLLANGGTQGVGHGSGCAGGAIYVKAHKLYLAPTALVQAKGGERLNSGGSGGGGGVALWRVSDRFGSVITSSTTAAELIESGIVSAAAGDVPDADHCQTHGTVVLMQLPKPGLTIIVR